MFGVIKKIAMYSLVAIYGMGFGSIAMDVYARAGHHMASVAAEDEVDTSQSNFDANNFIVSEASAEGVELKLELFNAHKKALPNKTVIFKVKRDGQSTDAYELKPFATVPDHDGIYVRQFIPKKEGSFAIDAVIGTKTMHLTFPIFARSAKPGPESTLRADHDEIFADGKTVAKITLAVRMPSVEDLGPNIASRLKLFDGNAVGPAFMAKDPKHGIYTADFATTVVGEHKLTVKYDDELLNNDKMKAKVVAIDPDVVEVSKSKFEANLPIIKVADKKGAQLTVSLKNIAGLAATNKKITFNVTRDGKLAIQGTDYNIAEKSRDAGKYVFTFIAHKVGKYEIRGTVDHRALEQIVKINVIKDNPLGQDSILSPASQTIKADNIAIATITLTAKDDDGRTLTTDIASHLSLWDELKKVEIPLPFEKDPKHSANYNVQFKTLIPGDHKLSICYDHIKQAVKSVVVHALPDDRPVDAAKSEILIDKATIMSRGTGFPSSYTESIITVRVKNNVGLPVVLDKSKVNLWVNGKEGEDEDDSIDVKEGNMPGEYKIVFSSGAQDKKYNIKVRIDDKVIIDKNQNIYVSSGKPGIKSELSLDKEGVFHLLALTDQGGIIPADISKHLRLRIGDFQRNELFMPVDISKGTYRLISLGGLPHDVSAVVLYDGHDTRVPPLKLP